MPVVVSSIPHVAAAIVFYRSTSSAMLRRPTFDQGCARYLLKILDPP